jgi:hypothetical protein
VIDDGSTDGSGAVAASYGTSICHITQKNAGVAAARNRGVLESRGEFLHFLDADDWVEPTFFEKQFVAISQNPQGDVFYGAVDYADENGGPLGGGWEPMLLGQNPYADLIHGNRIGAIHSAVIRRSALSRMGLFDTQLRSCEDWDLWIRLADARAVFVTVPDARCVYRQVPNSKSRNFARMRLATLRLLEKQFAMTSDQATRKYIRARQQYFKGKILADELKLRRAQGGWMAVAERCAAGFADDPTLLTTMAGRLASYLKRTIFLQGDVPAVDSPRMAIPAVAMQRITLAGSPPQPSSAQKIPMLAFSQHLAVPRSGGPADVLRS